MNMKRKQTRPEFKEFQRLPDWPIVVQPADTDRSLKDASAPKVEMAASLIEENRLGIRSLAE